MARALLCKGEHGIPPALTTRPIYMMANPQLPILEEPIGIVISRGDRAEKAPRFTAYVWGPAPVEPVDAPTAQAA